DVVPLVTAHLSPRAFPPSVMENRLPIRARPTPHPVQALKKRNRGLAPMPLRLQSKPVQALQPVKNQRKWHLQLGPKEIRSRVKQPLRFLSRSFCPPMTLVIG